MTAAPLDLADDVAVSQRVHRWYDPGSGCTLVVAPPWAEPGLWSDFVDGADRSYRTHGVECALDVGALASGQDTALFFAAVDDTGRMLGGLRAKGPYTSARESHALVEWAGEPGIDDVHTMITDRLPFGVAEMKSAWVAEDTDRSRSLTTTLARTAPHTMALLDVEFVMATAAAHVLDRWRSSGGVVAANIAPAPYPDHRYATRIMFWERKSILRHSEPHQAGKIAREMRALSRGEYANREGDAIVRIGPGRYVTH